MLASMLVMAGLSVVLLAGGNKYTRMISGVTPSNAHDTQTDHTIEGTADSERKNGSSVSNIFKVQCTNMSSFSC